MAAMRAAKQGNTVQDAIGAAPGDQTAVPINLPNAVTLGGYALGLWWVAGGPAWAAIVSIVADEVDGAIARKTGESTEFGSKFDWASDVILTALTLRKLDAPFWTIPAATIGQVALRDKNISPPLGSLRAGLMLYGVIKEGYSK